MTGRLQHQGHSLQAQAPHFLQDLKGDQQDRPGERFPRKIYLLPVEPQVALQVEHFPLKTSLLQEVLQVDLAAERLPLRTCLLREAQQVEVCPQAQEPFPHQHPIPADRVE